MLTSRRELLIGAAAAGVVGLTSRAARAEAPPVRGGALVVAQSAEPPALVSAFVASNPITTISPKIFDGLVTYDFDFKIKPQLAVSWSVAPDGREIVFKLRSGVRWHDGKPFTAQDVTYSMNEVWKKHNVRGKILYATVVGAEAPDPLTVVWRLSKPAPYIMYGLASHLSQIVPKHIYEGTDAPNNPANLKPIGTGPFKFAAWERGNFVRLERNAEYWDAGKPYLDQVIYRFLPDAGARAAALEAGDVHLVGESGVPAADLGRLIKVPHLEVTTKGYGYLGLNTYFLFNLDRPLFRDVRVRRAIAHALDRRFLVDTVWYGYADPVTGAFAPSMVQFFKHLGPEYAYDPDRAARLLDEAGLSRKSGGQRFAITHDFAPLGEQYARTADYVRAALGRLGIRVDVRSQDLAAYVRRIYTSRDFDTANYLLSTGPDPAIGIQRIYTSGGFQPGVPFSNGAHYTNADVDRLLERARSEIDLAKRKALYAEFQQIVQNELPQIPLIAPKAATITNRRLRQHTTVCEGIKGNFAEAYFAA